MLIRKIAILLTIIIFFNACTDVVKSRVSEFNYSGYGDSIYAVIDINVYASDGKTPLADVQIKAEKNGKSRTTNKDGFVEIPFEKGDYNIMIAKSGYQSIRLKNYHSDPDQISNATIILEQGVGTQNFELPEWMKGGSFYKEN